MKNKPSAFVTYGWCRSAYAVVCSLGRQGVAVHVGDASATAMSRYSRYCQSFTRLPDSFAEPDAYFDRLCAALKKTGATVLLPCHEDVQIVIERQAELPAGVCIAVPRQDDYTRMEDKLTCLETAQQYGVPVPAFCRVENADALETYAEQLGFPVVIKTRKGNGSKGTRVVRDPDALHKEFWELVNDYHIPPERWPILQEYLPGDIAWTGSVFDHGRCLGMSACHPLRHKETHVQGNATLRENAAYPELAAHTQTLLGGLAWNGIAQVEFIPDRHGVFKMTEINARPWGSLALPVAAGVDLPYLWYLSALGQAPDGCAASDENVRCRWLIGDGIGMVTRLKERRWKQVLEILKPQWGCYHDDFCLTDPLPFVFEAFDYLTKFVKGGGSTNPVTEGMVG